MVGLSFKMLEMSFTENECLKWTYAVSIHSTVSLLEILLTKCPQ